MSLPIPEHGITLLEASAGTGKTHALTRFTMELVVDRKIPLPKILIVTYTKAATAELRDRIWGELLARWQDPATPTEDRHHLGAAIQSFDEACITTIHAFCQRMLRQFVFESGSDAEVELVPDEKQLVRQADADFWRNQFYQGSERWAEWAVLAGLEPGQFSSKLELALTHRETRVLPEIKLPAVDETVRREFEEIFHLLENHLDDLPGDVREAEKRKKKLQDACRQLTDFARVLIDQGHLRSAGMALYSHLRDLKAGLNKSPAPPGSTPGVKLLQATCRLEESLANLAPALHAHYLPFVRDRLAGLKRQSRQMTYSDILVNLRDALVRPRAGDYLANLIRDRYRVALVDEFQDTDPVQFEIFDRLFSRPPHSLVLIGDPKQSIYRFRGADVSMILRARDKAEKTLPLDTNYRSTPALVERVNGLFSAHDDPFHNKGIPFMPVKAAENVNREVLTLPDEFDPSPLVLLLQEQARGQTSQARWQLLAWCAAEIARLLRSGARLGPNPIAPPDIAVLTHKHTEAEAMRRLLGQWKIPAVLQQKQSIFKSEEARDLARLLRALLEPFHRPLAGAALTTSLFGWTASRLAGDSEALMEQMEKLAGWRQLWLQEGFIAMFRALWNEERLPVRLLKLPDGERLVTNFQHLAEILQSESGHHTPDGLLRWLEDQGREEVGQPDERLLRMDKDAGAVKILTVHGSKGLQFPVVFVPGLLSSSNRRTPFAVRDPGDSNIFLYDYQKGGLGEQAEEEEAAAEQMRLFYVALTRAVHRCYAGIFYSNKDEVLGAPGHLLPSPTAWEDWASRNQVALIQLGETEPATPEPAPADAPAAPELQCRAFTGTPPEPERILSFTALSHARDLDDAEDDFLPPPLPAEPVAEDSIHAFPAGTTTGLFFHDLLERLDFRAPGDLPGLVRSGLRRFGLRKAVPEPVETVVAALLQTPLPLHDGEVTLPRIEAPLREAEFFFPVRRFTPEALAQALQTSEGETGPPRFQFQPAAGFMRGFIDLLFQVGGRYYLLDWKTNRLGADASAYSPEKLPGIIVANRYHLQYQLYALALHLFLRRRLPDYDPDRHFGGAIYVFLRGIDPAHPGRGIFHAPVTGAQLSRLAQTLLPE